MLAPVLHNPNEQTPIYKQIARNIANQIQAGELVKNEVLPSINIFSEKYAVARDTAEKAYKELKKSGHIGSVFGKGYFVLGKKDTKLRILLVFNKMSSFKKIIYYSFLKTLGEKATVDFYIHHYNVRHLETILENKLGAYDRYVIMPHFETNVPASTYNSILEKIPKGKLLLLDKFIPGFPDASGVYQDFQADICDGLESAIEILEKYKTISIVFPQHSHHPPEIVEGLKEFCHRYSKKFQVLENEVSPRLVKSTAYIVISDDDLANLVKKVRKSSFTIGKEIGIISFNESELKELLDITVMSTDFEKMGHTAAKLILNNEHKQIRNPFKLIKRGSC